MLRGSSSGLHCPKPITLQKSVPREVMQDGTVASGDTTGSGGHPDVTRRTALHLQPRHRAMVWGTGGPPGKMWVLGVAAATSQ